MEKPIENSYQQGDVKFRKLSCDSNAPRQLSKTVAQGRCIVAEGEGHHVHVIDAPETDAELIREGERMLLRLHKPAIVRHEIVGVPGSQADHKPMLLSAGLWEVGNVNEVDHFTQTIRPVVD
jgi:hypothetical protein